MPDLVHELAGWRGRRLCLLGVGNVERGDDGFGVRLAEALGPRLAGGPARALDAGTCPERYVDLTAQQGFEALVFADAARFGAAPGTLLLAGTAELLARPPAAATHRVPISVLAQYAEGLGLRAWLLAVEPWTLQGAELSRPVAGTLCVLTELLAGALGPSVPELGVAR
jgi:hydrogenase maturation protease